MQGPAEPSRQISSRIVSPNVTGTTGSAPESAGAELLGGTKSRRVHWTYMPHTNYGLEPRWHTAQVPLVNLHDSSLVWSRAHTKSYYRYVAPDIRAVRFWPAPPQPTRPMRRRLNHYFSRTAMIGVEDCNTAFSYDTGSADRNIRLIRAGYLFKDLCTPQIAYYSGDYCPSSGETFRTCRCLVCLQCHNSVLPDAGVR